MTDDRMALMEALQKADDGNFLRSLAETVLQILMEADVEGLIGASRCERSGERATWRCSYRDRALDTRLGQLNLRIPKLRTGSWFPPFLEARKTTEKALISVIQEAWIAGVSTRKVDDLVQAPPGPPGPVSCGDRMKGLLAFHGTIRDQQEPGRQAVQGDRRASAVS